MSFDKIFDLTAGVYFHFLEYCRCSHINRFLSRRIAEAAIYCSPYVVVVVVVVVVVLVFTLTRITKFVVTVETIVIDNGHRWLASLICCG